VWPELSPKFGEATGHAPGLRARRVFGKRAHTADMLVRMRHNTGSVIIAGSSVRLANFFTDWHESFIS
jgi:hypothetical protein